MRTPDGEKTVEAWMVAAGKHFHKIASTGFWSHIDKPDFKERIDALTESHEMAHVAQIMKAGCSHLLDDEYLLIVYCNLELVRFRTFQHEVSYRLVALKEFVDFYIENDQYWGRDKLRWFVYQFDRKPDDKPVADLWTEIENLPMSSINQLLKTKRESRKRKRGEGSGHYTVDTDQDSDAETNGQDSDTETNGT